MNKKITILIDQFYKHGGIEKLVALKANYWSSVFGYDVYIQSTENKNEKLIYNLNPNISFKDLNINYRRNISYFSPINVLLLLKNLIKIQIHLLIDKPDYIIVASHIPITYILPFLYRGETKISKEIHFTKFFKAKVKKGIKQKVFQFIESKYDSIIVLSNEEKTFYNTKNVIVISNPAVQNINTIITPITNKEKIATTISRFAPVKRLELLIEIWNELIKKGIKWKLYIYGDADNSYGNLIKKKINKYQLQNYVLLKGTTNHVSSVLKESRVSLLVSDQECFPMIILESFSVSVPVISFDCPTGPRNIITHNKNGLLVGNNDINAFVSIFEEFSNNEQLQKLLSDGAFQSADLYKLDKIMQEWQIKIFN